MAFIRILLLPFTIFYAIGVFVRNLFYDIGFLKSYSFDLPVISVGNLIVGGTGKTPVIEYLIRLLMKENYRIATLSRGYGRKTKGYLEASSLSTFEEVGDEPVQFKQKFNDITVAVCEKRAHGIEQLQHSYDVVLLDDAFQHRSVVPGVSILLYDYNRVFNFEFMLPTGNLRESGGEMSRASVILITRTPKIFSPMERRRVEIKIKPLPHQKVFYSYVKYGELLSLNPHHQPKVFSELDNKTHVVLLTGIANPLTLVNYIEDRFRSLTHLTYPDHHKFSLKDVEKLERTYNSIGGKDKIIITTEKDKSRLVVPKLKNAVEQLPIYYLPIEAEMHKEDKEAFDNLILNYVGTNKTNS